MIEAPTRQPALLTTEEAAAYLRIGETSLFQLMRDGVIPVVKLGRRTTRLALTDLDEFIAQSKV